MGLSTEYYMGSEINKLICIEAYNLYVVSKSKGIVL